MIQRLHSSAVGGALESNATEIAVSRGRVILVGAKRRLSFPVGQQRMAGCPVPQPAR